MSPEVDDAAFLALELPSYGFAPTTPEVAEDFRGFRIAAPKRVTAGPLMRLPVSAVARFAEESAKLPKPLWDSVAAVVVEVTKNRCWVASLLDPNIVPEPMPAGAAGDGGGAPGGEPASDEPPEEPPPPTEPDPNPELEEIDVGGVASQCAHVDLRVLLELPPTPGTYEISLTYGSWASNTVRVVVAPEED